MRGVRIVGSVFGNGNGFPIREIVRQSDVDDLPDSVWRNAEKRRMKKIGARVFVGVCGNGERFRVRILSKYFGSVEEEGFRIFRIETDSE